MTPGAGHTARRTREETLEWRRQKLRLWLEMRAEGTLARDAARALGVNNTDLARWAHKGVDADRTDR